MSETEDSFSYDPPRSQPPYAAEQMSVDPISKLATAIHDLADAARELAKSQAKSTASEAH